MTSLPSCLNDCHEIKLILISTYMRQPCRLFAFVASLAVALMSTGAHSGIKIKLGQDAQPKDFRFVAAIGMREDAATDVSFICTGTLVDSRHIITAAHCLFDQDGSPITASRLIVAVGQPELASFSRSGSFEVAKATPHPAYNPLTIADDIAVLTLTHRVAAAVDSKANFIAEPFLEGSLEPGTFVEIAGFGVAQEGNGLVRRTLRDGSSVNVGQSHLQMARVPLVDKDTCQAALDKIDPDEGLSRLRVGDGQVCAGFEQQSADACQGDSGGPLLYRGAKGQPFLVGIVSFGIGCGRDGVYGVYTRVGGYKGWLKSQLETR